MSQGVASAEKEEAILNMNCNCAGPNHFRDRHVFLSLYQQYVRPHLEFAVGGCLVTMDPGGHPVLGGGAAESCQGLRAISGFRVISGLRAST